MAVGDVISGIFNNTGTANYFQPSSGVEIIIVSSFGTAPNSTTFRTGIYNGTTNIYNTCRAFPDTNTNSRFITFNIKIGITNTIYFYVFGDDLPTAYTGIQTK